MSSPKKAQALNKFLEALENVKKDFTCACCLQICREPVTLSVCFHMVCSEHVKDLKNCPKCKVSLKSCKIFKDPDLGPTISATKALDLLFKSKIVDREQAAKSANPVSLKTSEQVKNRRPFKNLDVEDMLKNVNTQSTDKKTETPDKTTKSQLKKDSKLGSHETLNTTGLSNVSLSKNIRALEKRNNKGETALHIACRLGKIDKVAELLNQGAMPNTKDNAGWTPLHEVVQNGEIEIVKLLLQHNALINVPGQSNETPLHEAIRYEHKDIIELLVKNGADLDMRNIKGETPLQLAKGDLKMLIEKAAEEIIQTQSFNINQISAVQSELDLDEIRVFCVNQSQAVVNKLKTLAKQHSNLHIEPKLNKKVTHLIVDTNDDLICALSLDVLQGIVHAAWLLSSKWVTISTEEKLEPFKHYEVNGVGTKNYKGPKNARFNKYKQLPGLFNGCHFYLHNFQSKCEISKDLILTKASLSKLITDAGGVILKRVPNPESIPESERLVPYHAARDGKLVDCSHYIIFKDMYEPMYNMSHLKALPVGWLIECLEKYELCEPWAMEFD